MLTDINSIKQNHILGIQDNVGCPGLFLIEELIGSNSSSNIHIFCFDHYYLELQKELNANSMIHFHDFFPDLLETKSLDIEKIISLIVANNESSKKLIIIIDSLSTLLLEEKLDEVLRILEQIIVYNENKDGINFQIQVATIIHEDTIQDTDYTLKHLKHFCKAWIHVGQNIVTVSIKKSSGKLSIQSYEYKYDESNKLIQKKKKKVHKEKIVKTEDLPLSTFKLTLSENEVEERKAVKLPYEKTEFNKDITEGGQIFYEPDEYDDWDEEDPDNDLEFT